MSTKGYLIDASTRHQVFLQRYAGGESKKAIKTLNRIRRDINARLAQEPTEFQRNRLLSVLNDINQIYQAGFGEVYSQVKKSSYDLAANEASFSAELYGKASSANFVLPSSQALIAAVDNVAMNAKIGASNMTIEDALKQYGKVKPEEIAQTIRDGIALGDTTPQISKRVGELMNTLQRRQLDTLVRTATNHASSVARQMTYEQNSDLLDGYQWVATLDNKTTIICGSRDGEKYQVGIGPMPPAHWGCRSTTIPLVNPAFSLAAGMKTTRPAIGSEGVALVGGRETYGGWLKRQPSSFIDEALGPERARLFRSGKITLDKFVDPTGRVYSLDELKRMNPFVFQES